MKYSLKAKVFGMIFTKLLNSYYYSHNLNVDFKKYNKLIKKEYREMIERTPALGKGNFLVDNLIGASYFFALAKIMPNMTPKLMDDIVEECMRSEFMVNMYKKERKKGLIFKDKRQDKFVKLAGKSQVSNYEMDWKFSYEKHPNEFYLTYTKCGVCRLAQRENMLEYLPSMCKMDFTKYEIKGAKLERTKTLSNGDECCNFHVIRVPQNNK